MNVLVAFETLLRSAGEIYRRLDSSCSCIRTCDYRFMTSDAGRILMCAFEREFRRGMVEIAQLFPIPRVMASFAGLLGGVRISVAAGTSLVAEMILPGDRR